METINEVKEMLAEMEKVISLRQIAIQSKVNYVTLRNIKFNKSQRITEGVIIRLKEFKSGFSPETAKPEMKKRGRKPKAIVPVAVPKIETPAPAAKEPVVPVIVEPKAKRRGRVAKAKAIVTEAAPKKRERRSGKKNPAKKGPRSVKPVAAEPIKHVIPAVTMPLLGGMLDDEIHATKARLDYLESLKKIELEYLKKINRKG